MKFLIVGLIKGSQIIRLREEAEKLGHTVDGCQSGDLVIKSDGNNFQTFIKDQPLDDYDLIYLCAGVESNDRFEWYIACEFLTKNTKTKIVNSLVIDPNLKYYPRQTWFYLKQFENKIPHPLTYTVYSKSNLKKITDDLGFPLIVKLSETHQGKGVFEAKGIFDIEKIIFDNPKNTYLLRKFIPNDGDIRVFVIGGKAVSAMSRIPKEGDFRSNISRGGTGRPYNLGDNIEVKNLAERVAKITGVEIAGVDIIVDRLNGKKYVLEINVGPQFKGLEKYTGFNVAYEMVKYFELKSK